MSMLDPVLLTMFVLIVAVIAWQNVQIRSLSQRLESLEKQYLALIEDLEERLYDKP